MNVALIEGMRQQVENRKFTTMADVYARVLEVGGTLNQFQDSITVDAPKEFHAEIVAMIAAVTTEFNDATWQEVMNLCPKPIIEV